MEIRINEKVYTLPTSWNELSLKQQLACYTILMTDTHSVFEAQELLPAKRIGLVQYLLDLDLDFLKEWEIDCIQAHGEDGELVFLSELNEILSACDFLLEEVEDNKWQIKLGLTKCPYPKLEQKVKRRGRLKKKVYHAPADGLENLSIYELGTCFTLFEDYIQNKDLEKADELLATIYRPPKPATKFNKASAYQGDKRQPLLDHEGMVKKRQKKMEILPEGVKQLLLFWFASCRQQIIEDYAHLFDGKGKADGFGWGGLLMAIAGGIKDLDKVAKQPWSNALTYLAWVEENRNRNKKS